MSLAPSARSVPDVPRSFIDGAWVASAGSGTFELVDPATGDRLGIFPCGCAADADRAVAAASGAAAPWARTAPAERAAYLRRAAGRLRERLDVVAEVQTMEMGKPIGDSIGGVEA
ncbi:MAG: aldehyde dehydrogenase, partial [Frankiaceae bacterium]|nr:aldehyde dehydrogenase [Frankiaceae bacterium]